MTPDILDQDPLIILWEIRKYLEKHAHNVKGREIKSSIHLLIQIHTVEEFFLKSANKQKHNLLGKCNFNFYNVCFFVKINMC